MDVSVVTVNYRSLDHLPGCLASIRAAASGLGAEYMVVDNDTGGGAAALLREHFPDVRAIENTENVGYARAVNQGIGATGGEFVLVTNPDCVMRPGALMALVEYLRAHPRVAIAAPKILNPDGTLEYSARSFPNHLTFLFNRYSLLTRLFPNNAHSRRYLLSDWDHATIRRVDWVSGACMLVRRKAIEDVGAMDETFFMFNEDVDWCRRMNVSGWEVV